MNSLRLIGALAERTSQYRDVMSEKPSKSCSQPDTGLRDRFESL